jgi:hypothetical protein
MAEVGVNDIKLSGARGVVEPLMQRMPVGIGLARLHAQGIFFPVNQNLVILSKSNELDYFLVLGSADGFECCCMARTPQSLERAASKYRGSG